VGSVLDNKIIIKKRCHILAEEKLYNIDARLEHSQRKSLEKQAQQADVLVSSARNATKLPKRCCIK
jgi:hypothetical protein